MNNNNITDFLKSIVKLPTTVVHWTFFTPSADELEKISTKKSGNSAQYVEALFETLTEDCKQDYYVHRFVLFYDLASGTVQESAFEKLKQKDRPHPYIARTQLNNFFYNQFCKTRKMVMLRRSSNRLISPDISVSTASASNSSESSPIMTPRSTPPRNSFFGMPMKSQMRSRSNSSTNSGNSFSIEAMQKRMQALSLELEQNKNVEKNNTTI